MNEKDYTPESLGDRFSKYELDTRTFIVPEKYTILRLDGRGFSKFTKNFIEPFDDRFIACMNEAGKALFKSIQNVLYVYVQSDEISVILKPNELQEQLPFKGRTDKLLSLAASTVTGEFIRQMFITKLFDIEYIYDGKLPEFDCRYFQVDSLSEAINALIARQNDCKRNAISSIGQYHFSHKELNNKTTTDVTKMLLDIEVDVTKFHSHYLLGRLISRKNVTLYNENNEPYIRSNISIDDVTLPFRKRFDEIFTIVE